ncbi:MAG TPA: class I SAM-dependent methyltransferase [Thermoanaerobaculia bacterium]
MTEQATTPATAVDNLNQAAWSKPEGVAVFSGYHGFIDAGERAAFLAVAPRVRGQATLDVGVGGGRTVSLVRLLTDDYIAVDYVPAMVEECRRFYPGLDVRVGDARRLTDFEDSRFGFVLFSFNGIDSIEHEDREDVFREFRRVLKPGGWLVFSTHNMEGPSHRDAPWREYRRPAGGRIGNAVRWVARFPFKVPRYGRRWMNWARNRRINRIGDGWSVRVSAPHDFGIILHYVTIDALHRELATAGFTSVEVFDSERGAPVRIGDDTRHVHTFHVIAQKPR